MQIKKVNENNDNEIKIIQQIIKDVGEYVYSKNKLHDYWIDLLPLEFLKELAKNSNLYLCQLNNEYIATFYLTKTSPEYYINTNWKDIKAENCFYLKKMAVKPYI